jgi:hypothetical protein
MGATVQQNSNDGQSIYAFGFSNDIGLRNLIAATNVVPLDAFAADYKYNALFTRLNYNWKSKYILNFTGRRDGSSRFGDAIQFHNFGSAGLAWIFTEEAGLKQSRWLSFGKLRASYGTTGSDQIGDYRFLNLYQNVNLGVPYQGLIGSEPVGIHNPYLAWEETRKVQVGLDLGVLHDKISLSATYSRNRCTNQLLSFPLSSLTGADGVVLNLPVTVQNTTWEFSLNTLNITTNDFNWSTSFNISVPRNKLISFGNLPEANRGNYIEGQPVNVQKFFRFAGVDPVTGLYQVYDKDGKPTLNPSYHDDYTLLGTNFPKFYGGFQNNLGFKGLELDFLFQFTKQQGSNLLSGTTAPGVFGTFDGTGNQPTIVLNRWQKPGDIAPIQKFSASTPVEYYNLLSSNYVFTDASYIRLKNILLSWQLPSAYCQKLKLQHCMIYVKGQNLLTITRYKGLDPEVQGNSVLPPLKILTGGLQITL